MAGNKGRMQKDENGKDIGYQVTEPEAPDAPSASDKGSVTKANNRIKGLEAQVEGLTEAVEELKSEMTARPTMEVIRKHMFAIVNASSEEAEAADGDPIETDDGSDAGN